MDEYEFRMLSTNYTLPRNQLVTMHYPSHFFLIFFSIHPTLILMSCGYNVKLMIGKKGHWSQEGCGFPSKVPLFFQYIILKFAKLV